MLKRKHWAAGMTEHHIQRALYWRHRSARIMLPNYTPLAWQECDLFVVMRSGHCVEYEIKLSVADFRADFHKAKHDRLRSPGTTRFVPTRFFYVVPDSLVSVEAVPEYAGLMYCRWLKNRPPGAATIDVVREAPRLGKAKVEDRIIQHMGRTGYHRFWNERFRFDQYRRDVKRMAETARPGTVESK